LAQPLWGEPADLRDGLVRSWSSGAAADRRVDVSGLNAAAETQVAKQQVAKQQVAKQQVAKAALKTQIARAFVLRLPV
jgi:acid stress-induced BolA-like protein IbaG/YrbA